MRIQKLNEILDKAVNIVTNVIIKSDKEIKIKWNHLQK